MKACANSQLNFIGMIKGPEVTDFKEIKVEISVDTRPYRNCYEITIFIKPFNFLFNLLVAMRVNTVPGISKCVFFAKSIMTRQAQHGLIVYQAQCCFRINRYPRTKIRLS